MEHEKTNSLEMNSIAVVEIETTRPLFFDAYTENRYTGSLIVIDPANNLTVGAGLIMQSVIRKSGSSVPTGSERRQGHGERTYRTIWQHRSHCRARTTSKYELIERKLFDRGCLVAVAESHEAARSLQSAGMIALLNTESE